MRTLSPHLPDEFNLLGSMPQEEAFAPDLARTFQQLPNSHLGQNLAVGVGGMGGTLGHNAIK